MDAEERLLRGRRVSHESAWHRRVASVAGMLAWVVLGRSVLGMLASASGDEVRAANDHRVELEDCVVRFGREVEVPALASGRVAELAAEPNGTVARDGVLAVLDGRTLTPQRRAAELRVEVARSELSDDLEQRFAETALSEAEAELEASRSIYRDVAGAVPMTQLRRMRLAVERGELEVARAKKRRHQAELELQLREADLSLIDQQISNLRATSPLDGVVLRIHRSVGEWVETGATIATIAQIDRLHVHALADASEVTPRQCRGASATVSWVDPSTNEPRELHGRVTSVDPQVLPGGRYRVRAEIENRQETETEPGNGSEIGLNEPGSGGPWRLWPGHDVQMVIDVRQRIAKRRGIPERMRVDSANRPVR